MTDRTVLNHRQTAGAQFRVLLEQGPIYFLLNRPAQDQYVRMPGDEPLTECCE